MKNSTLYIAALPLAAGMAMAAPPSELLVLGSGASEGMPSPYCVCDFCRKARSAGGKNQRFRTAFQLGDTIRIDWGPDALAQMFQFQLEPWKLRHIFITHSHEDHLFSMDFWGRGVSQLPENSWITIYGNRQVLDAIDQMIAGEWQKNHLIPVLAEPGKMIELSEENLRVTPLAANHTSPEQSLMYAFESPDWRLLITGDTDVFPESSWDFLKGFKLNIMTIDATWGMEDRHETHLGIPNIAALSNRLRTIGAIDDHTQIIPVHFAHGKGARLHSELEQILRPYGMEPAYDGMRLQLETGKMEKEAPSSGSIFQK